MYVYPAEKLNQLKGDKIMERERNQAEIEGVDAILNYFTDEIIINRERKIPAEWIAENIFIPMINECLVGKEGF